MKITRRWQQVALWPVLPLLILLNACWGPPTPSATIPIASPTAPHVPTPTAPLGWSVHQSTSFQISLPASWNPIALDDAALKSKIDDASTNNPHLADTLRALLDSGQYKSFLFYAADTTATDVISNVSITRAPIPAGVQVEEVEREYAQALPQVLKGSKLVSLETALQINGSKAGEVDYDLPLVNAAGQVVTVRGVQFIFFPDSTGAYVVTISGDASKQETFVPLARQIGMSFLAASP